MHSTFEPLQALRKEILIAIPAFYAYTRRGPEDRGFLKVRSRRSGSPKV